MAIKLSQITETPRKSHFEVEVGGQKERVEFEYRPPTPRTLREVREALASAADDQATRFELVEYLNRVLVRIQDGDGLVEVDAKLVEDLPFEVIAAIYEAMQAEITPKKTT